MVNPNKLTPYEKFFWITFFLWSIGGFILLLLIPTKGSYNLIGLLWWTGIMVLSLIGTFMYVFMRIHKHRNDKDKYIDLK